MSPEKGPNQSGPVQLPPPCPGLGSAAIMAASCDGVNDFIRTTLRKRSKKSGRFDKGSCFGLGQSWLACCQDRAMLVADSREESSTFMRNCRARYNAGPVSFATGQAPAAVRASRYARYKTIPPPAPPAFPIRPVPGVLHDSVPNVQRLWALRGHTSDRR
jgi:hypothetical protein